MSMPSSHDSFRASSHVSSSRAWRDRGRRVTRLALISTICCLSCGGGNDDTTKVPVSTGMTYVVGTNIYTEDVNSLYLDVVPGVPQGTLDLAMAQEVAGGGTIRTFGGKTYVTSEANKTITRYEGVAGKLVPRQTMNLSEQGFDWMGEPYFQSAERAFFLNGAQLAVIEWNPSTMLLTKSYSLAAMKRDGWGYEARGAFVRKIDGKMFIYWAYTNDRLTFLNVFTVAVLDTNSGALTVLEDAACPSTAGFGGFFDEAGDLYLIADSFGGYTRLAGVPDPKNACVRRIRAGEDTFDPAYLWKPTESLGSGLEPWGFYYAGNGVAYTTAVDYTRTVEYNSGFEFIFAPIHQGYTIHVATRAAVKLAELPLDGVGFASVPLGDQLLIPRSTGTIQIYNIETVDTTVYALDGATGATKQLFKMPGYLDTVQPLP